MSKIIPIFSLIFALSLTACGQKGALYLPEKHTSEMPTQTDNSNNPNQTTPAINPNSQNPNIKIQDKINDY